MVLVVTRKPRFDGFLDAFHRDVVSAFAADGEIVVLALAVQVDGEGQILADGLKRCSFSLSRSALVQR